MPPHEERKSALSAVTSQAGNAPEAARPTVRFGVLGCSEIAWRRTLPALSASGRVTVTAVASRSAEKARRFAGRFGCAAHEGYDALLAREDVDAVYLPLPAMLHAEWAARALEAGKHVFAEKPLAATAAETESLIALARAKDLVLRENAMFLFHSQHAAVARMIDEGEIGELRGFTGVFTIPPKPEGDIRYQADVGGGTLLDVGFYPVRAALHFLGPELTVAGAVLRQEGAGGAVLSGSALLASPQGASAHLTFGMEHSYRCAYELAGSTGRLTLDRAFTPPPTWQPVVCVERQDHREERTLPADDQFAGVIESFAHEVLGNAGTDTELDASLHCARLVDDIAERALRAEA